MDKIRLSLSSNEAKAGLITGVIHGTPGWVAQKQEQDNIVFYNVPSEKPSWLFAWFKATRAISLTATLFPAIATLILCSGVFAEIDIFTVVTALLSMLMLQISVNVFNDVEDYLKLIDLPDTLGGSGVIQSGWLSTKSMKHFAWVMLLLACVFALPAITKSPVYISLCAVLAGLGVLGYSGKPFQFKYRALGDVFVFLLCGPVLTIGVSLAATNLVTLNAVILGCFFGLIACGILNANNLNDINVDTAQGGKTLASILGFAQARWLQLGYYGLALISLLPLSGLMGGLILLPWLLLPLVYRHLSILFKAKVCDEPSLAQVRFDAAKLHMALSLSICIGLWLAA